jgi:hypothetical protein
LETLAAIAATPRTQFNTANPQSSVSIHLADIRLSVGDHSGRDSPAVYAASRHWVRETQFGCAVGDQALRFVVEKKEREQAAPSGTKYATHLSEVLTRLAGQEVSEEG